MAGAGLADPQGESARRRILDRIRRVREDSVALCRPLAIEDYGLQTMPDASPAKWHLAHTTWFFETFLLAPFAPGYLPFHPVYDLLFNSYYLTHGTPFPRPQRGFLSRPTVAEVYEYREAVDGALAELITGADSADWPAIEPLAVLGLHHEQQHQELLLTDLKHALAHNPLKPAYRADLPDPPAHQSLAQGWRDYPGGICATGASGQAFAYDNELPRHRCWLENFALAERPVSNAEYLEFIADGGYRDPRWWLSEGWAEVQSQGWQAPLYWENRDGEWWHFTLAGMRPVDPAAPVAHVSYYEADAYASWVGRRLPTETEWEVAATAVSGFTAGANLREAGFLQPVAAPRTGHIAQLFGDVWEWTASAYTPYPGYRKADGPIGEYNGKFMSGQMVLRGGSCVTPADHIRASYRNFFYPGDRWQFSGIRLAGEL